jgi:hypothetical protein
LKGYHSRDYGMIILKRNLKLGMYCIQLAEGGVQ